jgi:hyperosmotically inducible periplasmic protein
MPLYLSPTTSRCERGLAKNIVALSSKSQRRSLFSLPERLLRAPDVNGRERPLTRRLRFIGPLRSSRRPPSGIAHRNTLQVAGGGSTMAREVLATRGEGASMRKQLFVAVLAIASASACKSKTNDPPARPAADNTKQNDRDRATTPTADNAVANASDLDVTQKIRKAVIDDGSLSTNAHNCKIVVQEGVVTLVGPVASQAERAKVEQIAVAVVGGDHKVLNQLEVTN